MPFPPEMPTSHWVCADAGEADAMRHTQQAKAAKRLLNDVNLPCSDFITRSPFSEAELSSRAFLSQGRSLPWQTAAVLSQGSSSLHAFHRMRYRGRCFACLALPGILSRLFLSPGRMVQKRAQSARPARISAGMRQAPLKADSRRDGADFSAGEQVCVALRFTLRILSYHGTADHLANINACLAPWDKDHEEAENGISRARTPHQRESDRTTSSRRRSALRVLAGLPQKREAFPRLVSTLLISIIQNDRSSTGTPAKDSEPEGGSPHLFTHLHPTMSPR